MKSKDLPKLIPNKVRIKRNVAYEIVYIDGFVGDGYQYGECRYESKQIVLNKNQPPTELFKTFIHEYLHAVSFEAPGLNLTEKQVRLLEEHLFRSLKLNGVFDLL